MPISPLLPRVSVRAARRKLPPGLVSVIDAQLRSSGHADRLDEVLDEVERVRTEVGSPPLAAPIGQIVGSQALVNVLAANRYATIIDEVRDLVLGRFGHTPGPIDPGPAARRRAARRRSTARSRSTSRRFAPEAQGLAASEEELLLLALFGDEAEPLLHSIRRRARGDDPIGEAGAANERDEQIRSVVADRAGDGRRRDHGRGGRRAGHRPARRSPRRVAEVRPADAGGDADDAAGATADSAGSSRVESPMVGTFYRSPGPGSPPFVEEGDPVSPGQVLCILEAMKLMNEVKAEIEAIVRRIHVADAEPVEYGQLLFELEPLNGRPVGI